MTDYSLEANDRELVFKGDLIAEHEATVEYADGTSCRMIANAYALEGGGCVSSLECQRSDHLDDPFFVFEEIDLLEDVEKFYYVFEPNEVFGSISELSREQRDEIANKSKMLATAYEKMVFAFLDQFQSEAVSRGAKDKPKPEKKEGSFWAKLGMS